MKQWNNFIDKINKIYLKILQKVIKYILLQNNLHIKK